MLAARILITGLLSIVGLSALACSASFPTEPSEPARVTTLVIHYPSLGTRLIANTSDRAGDTYPFEAFTIDSDGVYVDVTAQAGWASSDPAVLLQASRPGVFSRRNAGHATVTATYAGLIATLPVGVRGAPAAPYIEIDIGCCTSNRSVQLRREGARSLETVNRSEVVWSSSDERIAIIDSIGALHRRLPGNVVITATHGGMSDSYWISVPPREP